MILCFLFPALGMIFACAWNVKIPQKFFFFVFSWKNIKFAIFSCHFCLIFGFLYQQTLIRNYTELHYICRLNHQSRKNCWWSGTFHNTCRPYCKIMNNEWIMKDLPHYDLKKNDSGNITLTFISLIILIWEI